jgi:general secretion pathway protein B
MSYILEALKKSQQERELGQVPRLQAPMLDDALEPAREHPWVFAALGLATLAVLLALYAALQSTKSAAPSLEADVSLSASAEPASALEARPVNGTPAAASTTTEPAMTVETASAPPMAASDPDDLSVAPQVLVVPAPPPPGERLPRGADELRRAVLGPDASPSIEPRDAGRPSRLPTPEYAPVPPELIAEIEAFKRSYRPGAEEPDGSGAARSTSSTAAGSSGEGARGGSAEPAAASTRARPGPLNAALRQALPPFSMTVHVYDEEPARRFVYVNGSKVREGELTRDGFFVEQVLADGAIVRYDDHRFFQAP